jgi:hypothetical protein
MTGKGRAIADVVELLSYVDLTDIAHYEVSGVRRQSEPEEDFEPGVRDPQVMVRHEGGKLETRVRLAVDTDEARLVADIAAIYTLSEPLEVPDDVIAEFLERVGVMAVYPYLRAAIHGSAAQIGADAPVLGLLRSGSINVQPDEARVSTDEEESL